MALVVAGSAGIGMGFSVFSALGILLEPSGIGSGEAGFIGLIGSFYRVCSSYLYYKRICRIFLCGYLGLMIRVSVIYNLNISETITTVFFYFFTHIFTLIFIEMFIYIDLAGIPSIWAAAVFNAIVSIVIIVLLFSFNRKKKVIDTKDISLLQAGT